MRKTRQQAFEEKILSLDQQIEEGRQYSLQGNEESVVNDLFKEVVCKVLYEALETIDQPDREIFLMHSNGISQKEIGKFTNRTQVHVSRSIKRTRIKLLLILKNEYV